MSYTRTHLQETAAILRLLDVDAVESMVAMLAALKAAGSRIFFLGVGGGAANSSHAVSDFRTLAGIEAYAATDNVSEITARINDDGWASTFVEWLKVSRLHANDAVFVFSVGGGDVQRGVSPNVVAAVQYARQIGAKVLAVVGRDGGYTASVADAAVVVPTVNPATVTPHTEVFQGLIWHLLVTHPKLKVREPKWESVKA